MPSCHTKCRNRDYCCERECDPPFVVLPGPERCDKYSFPDCSLDCRSSESSEDDLRHLAKDSKFGKGFEPYLHRQCTVGTCVDGDSTSDCCPRKRGPKRYQCCGGKAERGHKVSCSKRKGKDDCSKDDYDHKGRKFTITLVEKKNHPQAHHIPRGATVWAVNGYAGARLNLYEGNTYYFEISPSCGKAQDFYLTADIVGGGGFSALCLPGTVSISEGVLCLRVDEHTPRCFYYQSMQGGHRGGMIIVSKKK